MIAETVQRFGTLHVLVANAGLERPAAVQDMTLADWKAVIDLNLTGAFLTPSAERRPAWRAARRPCGIKASCGSCSLMPPRQ